MPADAPEGTIHVFPDCYKIQSSLPSPLFTERPRPMPNQPSRQP